MGILLPALLAVAGIGGGVAAGMLYRPAMAPQVAISPCGEAAAPLEELAMDTATHDAAAPHDYVKIANQFVVPVVSDDAVSSLVVLSLNVETVQGKSDLIRDREPKLRDAFLQVLFDHANIGGFDGAFTRSENLDVLRGALLETARKTLGTDITDVLIEDIVRQDT